MASERGRRAVKSVQDITDSDFRELVSKLIKGMGLTTKAVRTSGQTVEIDAALDKTGESYLVVATRGLEEAQPKDMQKAVERMRKARVPKGIFLTTGGVSKDAELYAEQFELAVADSEKLGLLLEKFGLDDELERKATKVFLDKEGDRSLPSMGKLEGMMKWGYDFFSSGNYRKAMEYFQKAIELKPNYDVAHMMLGSCYGALGQYDKAVEHIEEALERNPESEEGWYNLGAMMFNLGRYEDELACYDKAISLNPNYDKAWNNKGVTLLAMDKYEEAIFCFDKGLKTNPKNDRALSNRGVALKHLGRNDEAMSSFDRAIAYNPDNFDAWLNKGLLLQDNGKYLEAAKCYDRVLGKMRSAELLAQKGSALVGARMWKAAIDSIEASLQLRPGWDVAIELRRKAEEGMAEDAKMKVVPAPEPVSLVKDIGKEPEKPVEEPPKTAPAQEVPESAPEQPEPVREHVRQVPPPKREEPEEGPPRKPDNWYQSLDDFASGKTEDEVIFTCSECGGEVGDNDKFCMHCGVDLSEEEEAEELSAGEPEEVERIEEGRHEEAAEYELDELVGIAEVCMRLGLYEDAYGRFGEALLLKEDPRLLKSQGSAAYEMGHHDDAVELYERALDKNPDDVGAAISRVESLLALGRHAAANEGIDALLRRVPGNLCLSLLKVDVLQSWGRDASAAEAMDEAAETQKGFEDLWNLEGTSLAAMGRADDALLCLDKAVQIDPHMWEAWCNRGAVQASRGELEQAVKSYDRALDIEECAVPAIIGKASILSEEGRCEEALELMASASAEPKSSEIFAMEAFLRLESDDLDGAIESADEGLRADDRSAELWNLRGLAYQRKKKFAEALESFEEAVSISPSFTDAMNNLDILRNELTGAEAVAEPAPPQRAKPVPEEIEPDEPAEPAAKPKKGVKCHKCGEDNDLGAKNCYSCGSKLTYKAKETALVKEMEDAIVGDKGRKPAARAKGKKAAKQSKEGFLRALMGVPGIGYAKANDLWDAGYRSEEDIDSAEIGELTRIKGITPGLARKLKKGI